MRNRTSSYSTGVLDQLRRANAEKDIKSFRGLVRMSGSLIRNCSFCESGNIEIVPVICSHGVWCYLCENCVKTGKIQITLRKKDVVPTVTLEDCPCYRILAEKLMDKKD
jgi:hypothetical protein